MSLQCDNLSGELQDQWSSSFYILPMFPLLYTRSLSDYDKDGKLSCDEFCIAMHLIDLVKMGAVLPAKLPQELVPGKAGRSGSFGTTVTPPPVIAPGMLYLLNSYATYKWVIS